MMDTRHYEVTVWQDGKKSNGADAWIVDVVEDGDTSHTMAVEETQDAAERVAAAIRADAATWEAQPCLILYQRAAKRVAALSKAAAAMGRKGGHVRGPSKARPLSSERARAIRARRRYYGIVALPTGSRICADEQQTVVAFRVLADRDRWLALGDGPDCCRYLQTWGEERRAATRGEALEVIREIMPGADAMALREIVALSVT